MINFEISSSQPRFLCSDCDEYERSDGISYPSTTFETIWNHFENRQEQEIIKILNSDPKLRDREFSIKTSTNSWEKRFFLDLACHFRTENVALFIINTSTVWCKGPKDMFISENAPKRTATEPKKFPCPLDCLSEMNNEFAKRLFGYLLERPDVQFYNLLKNVVFTSKFTSRQKVFVNLLEKQEFSKRLHLLRIRTGLMIIEPGSKSIDTFRSDSEYYSDVAQVNPMIIFNIAKNVDRLMFEVVMRRYYKEDFTEVHQQIEACISFPLAVKNLISDYCPYFLTKRVKDVVTLTETWFEEKNLRFSTPFIIAFQAFANYLMSNKYVIIEPSQIKKFIEFLKFLLSSGENTDRFPLTHYSHLDSLPSSILEDLKTKEVDVLATEICNYHKTKNTIARSAQLIMKLQRPE